MIGSEYDFRIAFGAKHGSLRSKLGAQFPEVVDLAIEHNGKSVNRVVHRLPRRFGEVDDGQSTMRQSNAAGLVPPFPQAVRTSMAQHVQGRREPFPLRSASLRCNSCYPAHESNAI